MPDTPRGSAAQLTVMQSHRAADCPDRATCWARDIHDTAATPGQLRPAVPPTTSAADCTTQQDAGESLVDDLIESRDWWAAEAERIERSYEQFVFAVGVMAIVGAFIAFWLGVSVG